MLCVMQEVIAVMQGGGVGFTHVGGWEGLPKSLRDVGIAEPLEDQLPTDCFTISFSRFLTSLRTTHGLGKLAKARVPTQRCGAMVTVSRKLH